MKHINNYIKQLLLILSINLFLIGNSLATTYYVSESGNDSNSGTSPSTPWESIAHAANNVAAGDIVYVKAGTYNNEQVTFPISGTSSNKIQFIGYKTTPGDASNVYTLYKSTIDGGTEPTLSATHLPLLQGANRATGNGFNLNGKNHIIIKNFQVTNYVKGVSAWGVVDGNTIENVIVTQIGDKNVDYSGCAISFGSHAYNANNNTLKNCVVFNSCAEGITVMGNNNLIRSCRVYCNDNSTLIKSAMDYYIVLKGKNNEVNGCYIKRIGDLAHFGHGIGVKGRNDGGECTGNTFVNCTAVNMKGCGFYVRHRGVKYNSFTNCTAVGGTGILVRDGASYNTFNRCKVRHGISGFRFLDTSEDGDAQYAGRYNIFKNCVLYSMDYAIDFHSYNRASPADNNTFVNCTFYNADYLFRTERQNYANKMINCIVSNMSNLKTGSKALSFKYSFTNFYNNNGFDILEGAGNTKFNPQFTNAAGGDFSLQASSQCIDRGTSLACVSRDYSNATRPKGCYYDMGALEANISCSKSASVAGIEEKKETSNTIIYPNPTTGPLTIESKGLQRIEVVNLNGQIIKVIEGNSSYNITLDLSSEPKGIYFVRIKTENGLETKKIAIM